MNISKLQSIGKLALCIFTTAMLLGSPLVAQGLGEPNPINRPVVITEPGSYILQRSFGLPGSGTAVTLRADHVTIDLNGQTLSGPGNTLGVGVSVEGASGVKIHQ